MYRENTYSNNIQNKFFNKPIPELTEVLINQNKGKKVKIYMSFPDSIEWRDKIFSGVIAGAGSNYILIIDNNRPILLQKIYINFIEFEESLSY